MDHEYRGHRNYAYVQFECNPADDLGFEARTLWPSTVVRGYDQKLELAVAEGVADVLLEGIYQHSGCQVVLVDVRYDDIESCEDAFMKAAILAMRSLLSKQWTPVGRGQ